VRVSSKLLTNLVLGKLGPLPSSHKSDIVGSTEHFSCTNTGIEVFNDFDQPRIQCVPVSLLKDPRTARDFELAWVCIEDCSASIALLL